MEKPEDSKKGSDAEKTVTIFQAAQSEDFELVKKLISDGADPLATQPGGHPNVLFILYCRLRCTVNTDKVLQIIKYILNLPEYQKLSEKSEAIYHYMLLRMARDLPYHFEIVSQMLQLMFKLKSIDYLVFEETIKTSTIHRQVVKMNTTALFIFHLLRDGKMDDQKYQILYRLFEIGFSMQDTQDCVTPLTILLLSVLNAQDYQIERENLMKLVHKFIMNGVNIESSVFSIQSVFGKNYPELDTMKTQLMVPDVLYLSILNKADQLVFKFVPHYWAPPLTLLYLNYPYSIQIWLSCYFRVFLKYGGVPHGTGMFAALHNHMKKASKFIRLKKKKQARDPNKKDSLAEYRHYNRSYKKLVGKN
jgi:hypothetical protein